MKKITYKSFCWNFGTTSFRTKDFNQKIERQLFLLKDFRKVNNDNWKANLQLQEKYYNYLINNNFIDGKAKRKDKDAREKTSGLKELGLINANRQLTDVGNQLVSISENNNYSSNNELHISNDSYLYLKQLLRISYNINDSNIRPFVLLIKFLLKFEYLSYEEFTYLLPLCVDKNTIENIINKIDSLRNNKTDINTIIYDVLISMDNYKYGLNMFLNNKVTEELICNIGINRKSAKYDKVYYKIYLEIKKCYITKQKNINDLANSIKNIKNNKVCTLWKNLLFGAKNKLKKNEFDNVKDEKEFKKIFYKYLHVFKAKATLEDYSDLNKRYVGLSDIILFENNEIKIDLLPKYYFKNIESEIDSIIFSDSYSLFYNVDINEILPNFICDEQTIINNIKKDYGIEIKTTTKIYELVEKNNIKKFNNLIDDKFNKEKLIELLGYFEDNNIKEIQKEVTDNADVPTIFEYIIGIIWYNLSERNGNILKFMKLSLDANMLPKSHAVGGEADIVYEYEKTKSYPKHDLLIEATLSEKTNQRRMEMEPVSRHLGEHISKTNNINDYCVFITNNLFLNVISDFRGRKASVYYDNNENEIKGLKIIPFEIKVLKKILKNDIMYNDLYKKFDIAYKLNENPKEWYDSFKTIFI